VTEAEHAEAMDATARAQRVLAGEEEPPVEFDKRLGASLDLVSGRLTCGACGMDTLGLVRAVALPSYLSPEMILAGMTCRTCGGEQAITLTQEDGAVVLATTRPR
jgi:hypothetical protein